MYKYLMTVTDGSQQLFELYPYPSLLSITTKWISIATITNKRFFLKLGLTKLLISSGTRNKIC